MRSLSFHAHYRCQHSGACCTSSWPIPVEADRLAAMRAAAATGRLRPAVFADAATPDAPALLRVVDRQCVFFDAERGRTCRVHATLGHDALPLACRQFPRVVVTDPRGVSVVLSHFCPTSAAMLTDESRVTIVENPPAFPSDGEYVGLDARDSLPPLLRPDVLMDWESWWEFERLAVEMLGNSPDPPAATLVRLRQIVEEIRTWSPGQGSLLTRVEGAFGRVRRADLQVRPTHDGHLNRLLAAHAFGNWTAHLGQGLRTWLRSIEAAHELMTSGHDVRQTDLELRHLSDPFEMARTWSAAEMESPR